jgi:hypothetical protein
MTLRYRRLTHKLMDADPKSPFQEGHSSAFHAAPCSASFDFFVDTLPDTGETRQTNVFDKVERAKASGVRQFVFIFPVDEFKSVEAKFTALRAKLKLKSNTEVLTALLND